MHWSACNMPKIILSEFNINMISKGHLDFILKLEIPPKSKNFDAKHPVKNFNKNKINNLNIFWTSFRVFLYHLVSFVSIFLSLG